MPSSGIGALAPGRASGAAEAPDGSSSATRTRASPRAARKGHASSRHRG
ncbi:hypothetical protein [Kitasatospora sp. NPDC059827]